jgi:hypothetical protein
MLSFEPSPNGHAPPAAPAVEDVQLRLQLAVVERQVALGEDQGGV